MPIYTFSCKDDEEAAAINMLLAERRRQDEQWGEQEHHPAYWLAILGKQIGQLGSAVLDREWAADHVKALTDKKASDEAVQAAAVAVAMVRAGLLGNWPGTLVTSQPTDPRQRAKALGRGHEAMDYERDGEQVLTNEPAGHGDPL